ncbi:ribosomal RNA small subunit methyltransferase A [bacterium]|nr:ribosomal RNA small subunit methyltransferase A [bacterium]
MGQKESKGIYSGIGRNAFVHLLKNEGITLSKEKGQHLLLNPTLLSRICDVAGVRETDDVLEIGAGIGNLTKVLARRARRVLAVEVDRRFQPILEKNLAPNKNVSLFYDDFLKVGREIILRYLSSPFKIVSNIPFSITAPILQKLVELREDLVFAVLTVQKEVGDKLIPPPNRYTTPLSLYITYHFKIERSFIIHKESFFPPPDVDARVIKLIPQHPPVTIDNEEEFFSFLRKIFRYKRKNIRNALQNAGYPIPSTSLSLDRRLESLSWEELKCLFLAVKK